ncbi:MAG: Bax inhibitor-1/YccA family protein [Lachnospiraceae bacterium]|nr:Bax inhibitor-1/YccA family protein [Lachnospiraceae bacterium]
MAEFHEFNNYDNNGSYNNGNDGQYHFDNYDLGGGYAQNVYRGADAYAPSLSLSGYIAKTFLWMFAGLMLTFAVSLGMLLSGATYNLVMGAGSLALIGVLIAQLAVVMILSTKVRSLSVGAARALFMAYAALNGVAFSVYFVYFDLTVLVLAFGATALLFGGMAVASLVFKLELDTIRPFLFGGLIMLLVFGVLGYFLNLGVFNTLICYLGIAIFMGYTAYDTSKIKDNYNYYVATGDNAMLEKASVFSALQLYLDFVNLLLYIIRLFARTGGRKSK